MYNLVQFGVKDMTSCGAALRALSTNAGSMEEVATRIVTHLYENLDVESEHACALVRLYKTHPLGALQPGPRKFAEDLMRDELLTDATPCLTLLGTAGIEPAWRGRGTSEGHQAIPLPSESVVEKIPMIAQLVRQFGLDIKALVQPNSEGAAPFFVDSEERSFNVFYVPDAEGSPYIPAQEFVRKYGVRSVIGFGGPLPNREMFSVIMFVRASIPQDIADQFRSVALNVKLALMPYAAKVFS